MSAFQRERNGSSGEGKGGAASKPPYLSGRWHEQRSLNRTKTLITMLSAFLILILGGSPVEAQTSDKFYGVPTYQLLNDLDFDLGIVQKSQNNTGYEVNFWALPSYSGNGNDTIMSIADYANINFGFNQVQNFMYFALVLNGTTWKSAAFTGYSVVPKPSTSLWINVNLRVMYGQYILLNAWQGNDWYELNPSVKVLNLTSNTTALEENSTMVIKKSSANYGCAIADIRVLKINEIDSYGQFLRHYEKPYANGNKWPFTITALFIRDGYFYSWPSLESLYKVSQYGLKYLNGTEVLRCNTSMAMQADGTCSMNCLTSKCLFCQTIDKQFYNICRYCDGVSSSCQPISKCPVDYYLEYGICYKCPIGCSSCSRGEVCTSCDSGLVLSQVTNVTSVTNAIGEVKEVVMVSSATCDCPLGQFGTKVYALDQVNCQKCDENCRTCAESNVKCTSCSSPKFLIDIEGGQCVDTCSQYIQNMFGDPSDRKCKYCASNCLKCTSLTGCTDCDNFIVSNKVMQNVSVNGVQQFDNNGAPVQEEVTVNTTKKLLNAEGVCLQSCPTNSIDNSTFFKCSMCPPECTTCSNISSNCTSCNITMGSLYTFKNTSYTPAKTDGRCLARCPQGFFADPFGSDQKICKKCDPSCTVCDALNYCTNCTMDYDNSLLYHFVGYQCKLDCGERYYPDHSDPSFYFCRNCPSNCLNCDNAHKCTACISNYYLTSLNGYELCVQDKDCAEGSYADDTTTPASCSLCISGCKRCDGNTGCNQCFDGKFLNDNTCVSDCPVGRYPLPNGTCTDCIPNCDKCKDSISCTKCTGGNVLLEDTKTCSVGAACPDGYFLNVGNNCTLCKPECQKCTSLTVCSACILGHHLDDQTKTKCEMNCGNGKREDIEYCDDGNNEDGDGCAGDCTVEDTFVCEQGVFATPTDLKAPDICRCDPLLRVAEWIDYWGTISIKFDSQIYYNPYMGNKSDSPKEFCKQILQNQTLNVLGTDYACYLYSATYSSQLVIEVDKDATIGNKDQNYQTYVYLKENVLKTGGCSYTGIPPKYYIKNLPLDTPQVLITSSQGTNQIGLCSGGVTLGLYQSKGFTKRNVDVTWTLISMNPPPAPSNDTNAKTLKDIIQENVDEFHKGKAFYSLNPTYVEMLQGRTLVIQAKVTNFLGRDSKNSTTIVFMKKKVIQIIDLPDTITFQTSILNQLYPRFRLPTCSNDQIDSMDAYYQPIKYRCQMYDVALTSKVWPLYNCTIPANNMTLTTNYIVQVIADYEGDPSLTTTKNVWVQPSSPPVQVATIQGCNRAFSPNNSFSLTAIYNTDPNSTTFVWQCTDKATGSVCFSQNYQYITLGNSESIVVGKDIFFYGMQYEFQVTAFDSKSSTNSSVSCMMYSSGPKDNILDVIIEGEATKTGFIDFNRKQTAFKAFITNMEVVAQKKLLSFSWWINDSSGKTFKENEVSVYNNSIGVSTDLMNSNSLYTVFVQVTDGKYWGNATQTLRTKPDISNEFKVESNELEPKPLSTLFSLSVYSQKTFDTLDQYVFGYIDPSDKITKIPMTQKTYKKLVEFILPEPAANSDNTIQCYVDVIMPNRVSMTYRRTVQLSPSDMTVSQFLDGMSTAIMDDIVESMQMKHKLVSLNKQDSMTNAQTSAVIKKILTGLQKETTPLSNFYIQTSVGSLLDYISNQNGPLMSDASIVRGLAQIFKQMTIDENSDLVNGKSLQYGKRVTSNLFDFANNLFQKDLTQLLLPQPGTGQSSLESWLKDWREMKKTFMQGLKNVLKGSLSNMILGDQGGFSYQGQNMFAKAVKFDQLEKEFKINSGLPKILMNRNLNQSFVNISLPTTNSNPCKGTAACQVSIIIIDSPLADFRSDSKEGVNKSMFVEMSLSETEVSSPYEYIVISDIKVTNLSDPIRMTIPLYEGLNKSNPNNTFGCGYVDEATEAQLFKQTGIGAEIINDRLVTCLPSHLTQIAVEQYVKDVKTAEEDSLDTKASSSSNESQDESVSSVNMWGSWAVYAVFALAGMVPIGAFWGRRIDLRDEQQLDKIKKNQKRIYVNLYLEPIKEIQKKVPQAAPAKKKPNEDGPAPQADGMFGEKPLVNQVVGGNDTFFGPTGIGLAGKTPVEEKGPIIEAGDEAALEVRSQRSLGSSKKKGKKKKKKTKTTDAVENDLFFEGGASSDFDASENETLDYFEGGDEDDFFAVAEAEESAKLSSKKKKKKKKGKTGLESTFGGGNEDSSFLPSIQPRGRTMAQDLLIEDIDTGRKSNKSRSKSRTKKSNGFQDDKSQISGANTSNFGGFKLQSEKSGKTTSTKKSKKKKKKSLRRKDSTDGEGFEERPDFVAEEIKPDKKGDSKSRKNKEQDDLEQVEALSMRSEAPQEATEQRLDTQSKGFETLMNEEIEKAKNQVKGKKKRAAAVKNQKDEKKKRKDYFEKEAATCVQFCIWNCKENQRCRTLFRYYNQYLSRPSRVLLFVMSWYLMLWFTGSLLNGNSFMAPKSVKTEQFVVGTISGLIARIFVVFATGLLMHSKREKVYQEIFDPSDAKSKVCLNTFRYGFGLAFVGLMIILSVVQVFKLAGTFQPDMGGWWMWTFIFGIISDLVVVDGIFIAIVTLLTMTIGSAPDNCGRCRNCWLNTIPEAVKDSSE